MTCDLDRPCNRCIKRNIGHLCHDEPRETPKKGKSQSDSVQGDDGGPSKENLSPEQPMNQLDQPSATNAAPDLSAAALPQNRVGNNAPLVQPTPVSASQMTGNNSCKPLPTRDLQVI